MQSRFLVWIQAEAFSSVLLWHPWISSEFGRVSEHRIPTRRGQTHPFGFRFRRSLLRTCVCSSVFVCASGACSTAGCLSQRCRPKVAFQLPFMTAGSELAAQSMSISTRQQEGSCFTASMATRRHRHTDSAAQLYDCWPRGCCLICCWERPAAAWCQDADAGISGVGRQDQPVHGKYISRSLVFPQKHKTNLINFLVFLLERGIICLFQGNVQDCIWINSVLVNM